MPGLILGMDGAEPPPADTAVECCGRIAGLIHGRNGLTRPLEVAGFCLIHLFQHIPSSCGQYTPGTRRAEVAQPHVNKALTSVRCASFNLLVGASEREQLFALGMLCTGTKRGQFFWGLGSVACPCSRKFCVAIADGRKRTFHCAPCDPRVECTRECDLCSAFGFLYYRARHVISFLH
jgi:hypothetical protein